MFVLEKNLKVKTEWEENFIGSAIMMFLEQDFVC